MKLKMLTAALALGSALVAGNAAAIVVGGVDFGALGDNPLNQHLETTTVAETVVLDNGQTFAAYGQINTVNGALNYTTTLGERLYFYIPDFGSNRYESQNFNVDGLGNGTVDFKNGRIEIYKGAEFNLLAQDSLANVAIITGYSEWVATQGHANAFLGDATSTLQADGTLTGSTLSFTGEALLDIVGGFGDPAVQAFLDANSIADLGGGFADIAYTTSANNLVQNPFDVANGLCGDASNPDVGDWCLQGSADLRGNTVVPEPSIMALMGMGLLGAGMVSLRRKKASKA